MLSDWSKILIDIEQRLFSHYGLNAHERCLYYHLISQTLAMERDTATLPLPQLSASLNYSEFTARKAIRSLADKGIIELEQTRRGHVVRPLLPAQLDLPDSPLADFEAVDLEEIDFYSNRSYLRPLMEREQRKCFYCLRDLKEDNCELDHVISQMKNGSNSYRNIVASCHTCNTRKQGMDADDYLRTLFRRGMLSEDELADRLNAIEALGDGELMPDVRGII